VHVTINNNATAPVRVPDTSDADDVQVVSGGAMTDAVSDRSDGDREKSLSPPPRVGPLAQAAATPAAPDAPKITQKHNKTFFAAALKTLALFVFSTRFLTSGRGKYADCARFLNNHPCWRPLFGPRKLENGKPFTGILQTDIQRWYTRSFKEKVARLGRPPTFSTEAMAFLKNLVVASGAPIGGDADGPRPPTDWSSLIITLQNGICQAHDKGLIANDKWFPSPPTIRRWLKSWGVVFRKATSGCPVPDNLDELARDMDARAAATAGLGKVERHHIYNADQAGIGLVANASNARTVLLEGHRGSVRILGSGDKRQFTAVTMCSADGDVFAPQLVFKGLTKRSLPTDDAFKPLKDIMGTATYTPNHWSTVDTTIEFIDRHAVPIMQKRKRDRQEPADTNCIMFLDCWHGHTAAKVRMHVRKKYPWLHILYIPANCTSKLQVCDIAVQRPFKKGIMDAYTADIREQCKLESSKPNAGGPGDIVKRLLSVPRLRNQVPKWVVAGVQAAAANREGIVRAWDRVLPYLTSKELRQEAIKRCYDNNLLASLDVPTGVEEDGDPYPDTDVAERLADAVATAAIPMKRRRRDVDDDVGNATEQDTDEDEDVVLCDDDEEEKSSDMDDEDIDRALAVAEDALDDDEDDALVEARALKQSVDEVADAGTQARVRRLAASKCAQMYKKLNKLGRL
jgi:hypothetical protein